MKDGNRKVTRPTRGCQIIARVSESRAGPSPLLLLFSLSLLLSYTCVTHTYLRTSLMKHRLLIDWLWWIPVVLYGFDMVPTKVELTGTITNILDWTTEVTNFNLNYQAVGYSPFTTTNPNRTIVWTLTVLPLCVVWNHSQVVSTT